MAHLVSKIPLELAGEVDLIRMSKMDLPWSTTDNSLVSEVGGPASQQKDSAGMPKLTWTAGW